MEELTFVDTVIKDWAGGLNLGWKRRLSLHSIIRDMRWFATTHAADSQTWLLAWGFFLK